MSLCASRIGSTAIHLLATICLWACTGTIGSPSGQKGDDSDPNQPGAATGAAGPTGAGATASCTSSMSMGTTPLRRLSRTEYINTARDLLKDPTLEPDVITDPLALGFDNNAAVLTVTPTAADRYMTVAESLAAAATTNLGALSPCLSTATSATESGCVQQFLRDFAGRAFRRPLEDAEVTSLFNLFSSARKDGDTLAQALGTAIAGILQSPYFLYRVEVSAPASGSSYAQLSPWEIASRLSYLLWGSMPDDALFTAARTNQLGSKEAILTQAKRMMDDERTRAMVADFDQHWLLTYKLTSIQKDNVTFPDFTPAVATAMQTETDAFVDDVVWKSGGNMMDLFTAPYTFRNKTLSDYYKSGAGVTGSTFARVELDANRYAGLLTQGGVMAAIAHTNQTDPTRRGKFIRVQLMCESIPPPPPNVMAVPTNPDPNMTTRQRAENQRGSGVCGGCHQLMDKIGFGFEHFDAVGRWRDQENGKPIDATGEIVDTDVPGAFDGAAELGKKIASSAELRSCTVTQWFRFAAGRDEESADACTLEPLKTAFADSGNRVRDLLLATTQSDAFMYRTVEGSTP
jgi:hypothetical protein